MRRSRRCEGINEMWILHRNISDNRVELDKDKEQAGNGAHQLHSTPFPVNPNKRGLMVCCSHLRSSVNCDIAALGSPLETDRFFHQDHRPNTALQLLFVLVHPSRHSRCY
ncbi:hypothetical protein OPV22_033460 [Ensete ventricosum]|uniref:Uncharacterized protein n=1 Tax=Ensete ventricosum TaxID=4639 RepID=A0AAV8PUD5_ENSVE|nr:hypothetical protein OPV22_033460 [Ensete ventricosum]